MRRYAIVFIFILACILALVPAIIAKANDQTQVSRSAVVSEARTALITSQTPDAASLTNAFWATVPTITLGNASKVALVANFSDATATGKMRLIRGTIVGGVWQPSPFTTTADVAPIATFTNSDGTIPSEAVDFDTLGFPAAKVAEQASKGSISVTAAVR